jgi:hypothetical protein
MKIKKIRIQNGSSFELLKKLTFFVSQTILWNNSFWTFLNKIRTVTVSYGTVDNNSSLQQVIFNCSENL